MCFNGFASRMHTAIAMENACMCTIRPPNTHKRTTLVFLVRCGAVSADVEWQHRVRIHNSSSLQFVYVQHANDPSAYDITTTIP